MKVINQVTAFKLTREKLAEIFKCTGFESIPSEIDKLRKYYYKDKMMPRVPAIDYHVIDEN